MKPFTTVAIVLFVVIALVHVLRLALHWPVVINGMAVPEWVSVVAALATAILAVMLWRESRR